MSTSLSPLFLLNSSSAKNMEIMIGNESNFVKMFINSSDVEPETKISLPIDMQFNEGHLLSIIVYSILFIIGAAGNITLLVTILRLSMKGRLGRVNLFLLHLAIADLLVTFLLMPLEIGWAITVSWTAGDLPCRILSFFRTFGLYLSGFLIVCISLDRYFAVLKPLSLPEANRRGRIMLYSSWLASFICSFPQVFIFHVEKHPVFQWFEQCITYNSFSSEEAELAYSIFGFIIMYAFPFSMITFSYSSILHQIFKMYQIHRKGEDIRRSNVTTLGRAKVRTLKMTVMIVATFFLCWTPYNIMCLWFWIDKTSALKVDFRIQKSLFLFAVTNSCFNPIVYGLFHMRKKNPASTPTPLQVNNAFNLRNEREPYKMRVRWRGRAECMCTPQSGSSSSNLSHPLRPIYEINGQEVKSEGQGSRYTHLNHTAQSTSKQQVGNGRKMGCKCEKNEKSIQNGGGVHGLIGATRSNGGEEIPLYLLKRNEELK